jgi:serine/threonine-protein kinase RsbW
MDTKRAKADSKGYVFKPSLGRRPYARTFYIPNIDRMELLNEVLDVLRGEGLSNEFLFWVRLSIDEAIINAIIHGHGEDFDEPISTVRVDCIIDDESIAARVTDTGLGFNPAAVPDPTLDENLWRITGRGIFLMRQAMDQVIYNDIGNSVLLIRKFDKAKSNR